MNGFETLAGETPIDDLSGLIPKGITTRAELSVAEAENIRRATLKYLGAKPSVRTAPFTVEWLLRLHREMLGKVWRWAGIPRRTAKNIGVSACAIAEELKKLVDDLRFWERHGSMPLIEQAARLHHRAVFIHPFENGNGRWARLAASIWLRRAGASPTAWPEGTLGGESVIRGEYLTAIREADGGDYEALIGMHQRYTAPRGQNPSGAGETAGARVPTNERPARGRRAPSTAAATPPPAPPPASRRGAPGSGPSPRRRARRRGR